jgi:hypothetical protein
MVSFQDTLEKIFPLFKDLSLATLLIGRLWRLMGAYGIFGQTLL